MEPSFIHVNIDLTNGARDIWSQDINDVLPDGEVQIVARPFEGSDPPDNWSPAHLFTVASGNSSIPFFRSGDH